MSIIAIYITVAAIIFGSWMLVDLADIFHEDH